MHTALHHAPRPHFRDYALVLFLAVSLIILSLPEKIAPTLALPERSSLVVNGTTILVEVARTPAERSRGLSGHAPLAENEGMLFPFDAPDRYSFWMPDMLFSIDIIWIGPDWRIVDISHNVTPESYPEVFAPEVPAQYVLEVAAGSAERYGWKAGDGVE